MSTSRHGFMHTRSRGTDISKEKYVYFCRSGEIRYFQRRNTSFSHFFAVELSCLFLLHFISVFMRLMECNVGCASRSSLQRTLYSVTAIQCVLTEKNGHCLDPTKTLKLCNWVLSVGLSTQQVEHDLSSTAYPLATELSHGISNRIPQNAR